MRVVYAMRKDGCELDASFFSAYLRGKSQGNNKAKRSNLLQTSYERLLAAELNPEQMGGPRFGGIERIRIQF